MKSWAKFAGLLLALVLCMSVAACGGDTEAPTESEPGEGAERAVSVDNKEEVDQAPDISGYVGNWKVENQPYYIVINDKSKWAAVNLLGEEIGPGDVVAGDGSITLLLEDGKEMDSIQKGADGALSDSGGNALTPVDSVMLLPRSQDELTQTTYFSGDFSNVSINYPAQMTAQAHSTINNSVSFGAVMAGGTADYYSNILIAFAPISGYDPYMENGSASAKPYMIQMLNHFMDGVYGDNLINSIGTDFQDNGSYYSLIAYVWLNGTIYEDSLSEPVRATMEVRYYGPTGYALVASTVALESRIQNYFDICNNILSTLSYSSGWSTAPKPRPAQPAPKPSYSGSSGASDSGDYGTAYYWYDEDGDIWYWNGYENEFIGFGSGGYIDYDTGEYMESNDAGWDYEDEYYEDYDPWSDPGDGWGDYVGDDDGWGDYVDDSWDYDDYDYDYDYDYGYDDYDYSYDDWSDY